VIARLKQLPADLRREVHRRRALAEERAGFRRAGERLAATEEVPSGSPSLREEVRRATAELDGLAAERLVVGEAELRDLARVGWWVRPAVIARTVSSRVVLQHDRRRAQRALDAAHEALGRAAALGGAVWEQLRSHLLPKAPALVGMAVGWWIADTYTDSHIRSALRTIGIGSGGTHVVSGSTYRAMTFWLPLLAAAVCAYAGERLWQRVVGREEQRA
jgi:hypothetical protein